MNLECLKGKKKVSVVGFAPSWNKTKFDDPEMVVAGINSLYSFFDQIPNSHCEFFFDLHQAQHIREQDDDGKHIPRLKQMIEQGVNVFLCEEMEELPGANIYPIENITEAVGLNYWTNTISYLIAYFGWLKQTGVWPELEEMHILGVDMAQSGEYAFQRPSCELIIGWILGNGIKVNIPSESDLCRSFYRYGFDQFPFHTQIFRDKITEHKKQLDNLQKQRNQLVAWRNTEIQKIEGSFNQQINQIDAFINQIRGAIDLSEYYMRAMMAENNGVPFNPTLTELDLKIAEEKKNKK
jgi:hypothetical protein